MIRTVLQISSHLVKEVISFLFNFLVAHLRIIAEVMDGFDAVVYPGYGQLIKLYLFFLVGACTF